MTNSAWLSQIALGASLCVCSIGAGCSAKPTPTKVPVEAPRAPVEVAPDEVAPPAPMDPKAFTSVVPVPGSIDDAGEWWTVKLEMEGERFAFRATPPVDCLPPDWPHDEWREVEERRHATNALRVDLGQVNGRLVWLRLAADSAELILEDEGCNKATDVTEWFVGLPVTSDIDGAEVTIDVADGRWKFGADQEVGGLSVRQVAGGIEVWQDSDLVIAPKPMATPKSSGCLLGSLAAGHDSGTARWFSWRYDFHTDCDLDRVDSKLESGEADFVREPDGGFSTRRSSQVHPRTTAPETWVGPELEWRRTPLSAKREARVDWAEGADCGHEIYEEDLLSRWEVRVAGGAWIVLGDASQSRFTRLACSDLAGAP